MPSNGAWAVSVVMPAYNGERFLRAALDSVLAQTALPGELIVVDDGSTDDSAAIVQCAAASGRLPVRYVHQQNQGAAAARNRGIELAASPLIAFLDQDDLWLPQKLAHQCELLRRQPAAGYSITLVEYFVDDAQPAPAWVRPELLKQAQVGYLPSSLLVRQSIFQQVGLFDSALPNHSDADWFARVLDAAIPAAIVPEVLVRYRVHGDNRSRFVQDNQRDLYKVVRKAVARKRLSGAAVDTNLATPGAQ